ncbi:sodium/nucleoside cotransporter 1-like [Tachyglossus aculeatus]|uniref:sodium/nucleoside cotransporter 1-like n=1 Tax=Tachyglossus aculeatus TaxID=9261 RepID=UPI0018F704CD|nr:sodium/nucleoside cotransporter 1-like [Tachyglossus aculeatus]XP_038606254.1 sodium/nucleoside cotransporter 1-like [Tachyglossus aculeatus]XP_038606255.1 sodium/nucleoside cotransporter 1-like [Tachyglossus aculeatus]XP_038606257.1 sodium/nucleoside cotransporter 1-like [Tachyglossus aculeatus]XP_038606258.1 sodium/nucleoside cotransporter 1-like [Tachyglossus aculeatus]XP_038606259.1 sodium/nucleoside cotransporter 1-like [Tachyglossus aculeatus]XP_038606260.1 sodium/nucleoside cotransp
MEDLEAGTEGERRRNHGSSLDSGMENQDLELTEKDRGIEEGLCTAERKDSRGDGARSSSASRNLQIISRAKSFCQAHAQIIRWIFVGLGCAGYAAYLLAACILDFRRALALFIITFVVLFFLAYDWFQKHFGNKMKGCLKPLGNSRLKRWLKWGLGAVVLLSLILWLGLDTAKRPKQLISFAGVCMFVAILFACSKSHRKVSWRAVLWGLGLQFVLGIFVIRTDPGFIAFEWLGEQIRVFLNYTVAGSGFVFGEKLVKEVFAFQALPVIIFFSCLMSILYYLGLMQWLILKVSWLLQVTLGTTATETLSVAGNIFVGMTEAPLLIRPYLKDMTISEIHSVMTGGFATIAGSVMGAYITFGIDPAALISASVMAAPCVLALTKLVYPEMEESKFKDEEGVKLPPGEEQNILEAASSGAATSVVLIANIAANLVAFLAMLAFINAVLSWLGEMVDIEGLNFQLICSYVLLPMAFMMGVDWADCPMVAEMIGIKFFLNEFVAYQQLSQYKNKRLSGMDEWIDGKKQWISIRAEIITTFALCGFANLTSIGIMLAGLTSIVPSRKSDFSKVVISALLTGACVSLVNACVAGILYVPRGAETDCISFLSTTIISNRTYDLNVCCKELFQSTTIVNKTYVLSDPWVKAGLTNQTVSNCCRLFNHNVCTVPSIFS